MAPVKLRSSAWLLAGFALTWACGSGSAASGGTAGDGGGAEGGNGPLSGTGGTAPFAVEGTPWIDENTAGTGLVSNVFGDPLSFGSAGVEPIACPHPSPGSCDWTRRETGCCSSLQCVNATLDPYDPYPIDSCRALVDCLQANPGCPTVDDPFCANRNGDAVSACTVAYENNGFDATSTDEGRLHMGQYVRDILSCVCGI